MTTDFAKAMELKAMELKAMELKAMELKAMELKAMELKAMELKAMELKAMELKAMELKAMELTKVAGLGFDEVSKLRRVEAELRTKLNGPDKALADSVQVIRQKVEALLKSLESGLGALGLSMVGQTAKSDESRPVHIHLHLP